ncbi:MAG: ROK family protein [Desulfosarcinaceae bacterium]|nr:ROK family protein [Desulfosarcinaceae bacterium]
MRAPGGFQIGIDLGGTKIEAVLLDPQRKEVLRKRVATPVGTADDHLAILEGVHQQVVAAAAHIPEGAHYTIGVCIPGIVDARTGVVQNANTTSLIGHPFQAELEARLGHPVGMENDANCFTLAEALRGAGRAYRMVFGIIMGTGCGGGLCIEGRLHDGLHGIAGEWGHFSIDPRGATCFCGNRGCVETKISGTGVARHHRERWGKRLRMEEIVAGYRSGDPQCRETFEDFLDDFGRSLGGLISLLDPDAVVIGGGLSHIDELYTLGRERVQTYAFHPKAQTPILKNQLGDSAGIYGAAWAGR